MDPYRQPLIQPTNPCRRCGTNEADDTIICDVKPTPLPLCHPRFYEWAGRSYGYFCSLKGKSMFWFRKKNPRQVALKKLQATLDKCSKQLIDLTGKYFHSPPSKDFLRTDAIQALAEDLSSAHTCVQVLLGIEEGEKQGKQ